MNKEEYMKIWRIQNAEKLREYSKSYYWEHKKERQRYSEEYRKSNPKVVADRTKKWKNDNREYIKQRQYDYDNLRFYSGNKDIVLKRDNYKCQLCGTKEKLHIHHIDNNKKNNDIGNLITLCIGCHAELHHWQRKEKLNAFLDFNKLEIYMAYE